MPTPSLSYSKKPRVTGAQGILIYMVCTPLFHAVVILQRTFELTVKFELTNKQNVLISLMYIRVIWGHRLVAF